MTYRKVEEEVLRAILAEEDALTPRGQREAAAEILELRAEVEALRTRNMTTANQYLDMLESRNRWQDLAEKRAGYMLKLKNKIKELTDETDTGTEEHY